jgi:hypothetical protein
LDTFWADKQSNFDPLRSTGLYAKAGTIIEITVAKELIGKIMVITFKMKLICNVLDNDLTMINLVILYTNLCNFSQLQFELKNTKIATIC